MDTEVKYDIGRECPQYEHLRALAIKVMNEHPSANVLDLMIFTAQSALDEWGFAQVHW